MASIEFWDAAGSVMGGAGGLAGIAALVMQLRERGRQRKFAHAPPELASVLTEVLNLGTEAVTSTRYADWSVDKMRPATQRLREASTALDARVPAGYRGPLTRGSLEKACGWALLTGSPLIRKADSQGNEVPWTGDAADNRALQKEAATELVAECSQLLRLIGSS